jgi:hypothetical protein
MKSETKKTKPVYITAIVEESQHEALKFVAFREQKTMAEIVQAALEDYILKKSQEYPIRVA